MRKRLPILLTFALAALACALPVRAQFTKPQDALAYRKAVFRVMGHHMGRIAQVARGRVAYEKDAVVRSAEVVEALSRLPYEAFVAGSDLPESKAKPTVWSEESKFQQLARDTQAEAAKLTAAARSGSFDGIVAQFRATAKSCDSCHDTYREK